MGLSAVARNKWDRPWLQQVYGHTKRWRELCWEEFSREGSMMRRNTRLEVVFQVGHWVTGATFTITNLLCANSNVINFHWPYKKIYTSLHTTSIYLCWCWCCSVAFPWHFHFPQCILDISCVCGGIHIKYTELFMFPALSQASPSLHDSKENKHKL